MQTTIREFLASFTSGKDIDASSIFSEALDMPCTVNFVVSEKSELFVLCSGQVLMGFYFNTPSHRQPVYLVLDNLAGKSWEATVRGNGINIPRPNDRLRLVQSA